MLIRYKHYFISDMEKKTVYLAKHWWNIQYMGMCYIHVVRKPKDSVGTSLKKYDP